MSFRLVLSADLHGSERTEPEFREAISLWEDAYILAKQNWAQGIAWLGDLLHFKYGMSARILLRWSEIAAANGLPNFVVRGNHDTPWKSEPELTVLSLIHGVKMVTRPLVTYVEDTMLAFLPWYPPAVFERLSSDLASRAMEHKGPKFLFSHVSLAEGVASISNIRVEQATRARHLHPGIWTHVFLGDYHAHQKVGENITYLGAPRPTTFGDYDCLGFWLLTVDGASWNLELLKPPTKYPDYIHVQLGHEEPVIPNYDERDRYSVTAPMEMHRELLRRYPGIKLHKLPEESVVASAPVQPAEHLTTWDATIQWMNQEGLNPILYHPIARRLISAVHTS